LKVALVNLPFPVQVVREGRCQHEAAIWDTVYPPLELAVLAALLRKDHDVLLLDAVGERLDNEQTLDRLKQFDPDWLFCPVSTPTIDHDLKVLKDIKEVEVEVVWEPEWSFDMADQHVKDKNSDIER